jgi:prepilin-type N-terminal cleavage/methylation domain-containing protein
MNRKSQKGFSLIEVLVAMALLGVIGVAFLSALAASSLAIITTDEHQKAKTIAEMEMEYIKNLPYAANYTPVDLPSEYSGFSVVTVDGVIYPQNISDNTDEKIQKVEITIQRDSKELYTLVSYKAQ